MGEEPSNASELNSFKGITKQSDESAHSSEQEERNSTVTKDQLKKILNSYRSKLPSAVINELFESLSEMELSEEEVVSIVNEVQNKYANGTREELEDIMMRMQKNDMVLKSITEKLEQIANSLGNKPAGPSADSEKKAEELKSQAQPAKASVESEKQTQESQSIPPNILVLGKKQKQPEPEALSQQQESVALSEKIIQEEQEPAITEQQRKESMKPLLSLIKKDPFSMAVLMRWIEFLLKKVGNEKLSDVLDYYLDIGWISEEVVLQVLTYAKGMEVQAEKGSRKKLTPEDHFKTLLFIEKMRGTPIDRLTLTKMERELALLTKKSDDYDDIYGI